MLFIHMCPGGGRRVQRGHQTPEIERVVGGNGRYFVVETIGAAAEIAYAGASRRP